MRRHGWALAVAALCAAYGLQAAEAGVDPGEAWKRLVEGNRRFATGAVVRPHQNAARRAETAKGQHPFAAVFGCSDSRVPPEILFDQGMGDLFVTRTAGHVADDAVQGSLEYAVEHLSVRLIVVLGHDRCGAVEAALQAGHAPGHIGALVNAIRPGLPNAAPPGGDLLDSAVDANIRSAVAKLKASAPILAELVAKGAVRVSGARYHLASGAVEAVR